MNKKFFGALIFGALLTASTGTFVSCSDYDDEIDNLQEQIDKLAGKAELESQVSALSGQISSAASVASAAQAAADAAAKAAKEGKDAADAVAAKLGDYSTKAELKAVEEVAAAAAAAAKEGKDVAAAAQAAADKIADELAALEARVKSVEATLKTLATQAALDELKTEVEALAKDLKAYLGAYKTMVTEVSLVESFNAPNPVMSQGHTMGFSGNPINLGFKAVSEQTTVFGKGLPGEITFEAGKSHSVLTSNIVIRVNPANATLEKEDIKIINSKGEALDVIEVVEVKPYEGLLTRAAANTGLWTVSVKVKDDVTTEELKKATQTKVNNVDKEICYAVAVGDAERSVVSTYDIIAAPNAWEPSHKIDAFISDKDGKFESIADIHNRFTQSENGSANDCATHEELVWFKADAKSVAPAIAEEIYKTTDAAKEQYQNVINRGGGTWESADDRQGENLLPVEVNKPIDLHIQWTADNKKVDNDIKGFYVALDERNAVESAPSEINAWRSYEVENLNKVQTGNTGSITIKSASANGDVIGFRIYAVNLDGTLLDPDGKAFYVYVGDATKIGTVPTQTIKAIAQTTSKTTADFLDDFKTAAAGANDATYTATGWTNTKAAVLKDVNGTVVYGSIAAEKPEFEVWVTDASNTDVQVTSANVMTINFAKIKKAWYVMPDATKFVDGGTYEQNMKIYKSVGGTPVLVKTITVSFTKVMPNEAPVVNYITGQTGELLLAPVANPTTLAHYGYTGAIANQASINLNNVYYELSREAANTIKFSVDNSAWVAAKNAYADPVAGSNTATATNLVVANSNDAAFTALTDGSAHTIKFSGFYPNVSLRLKEDLSALDTDHDFSTAETKNFDVTYNCWHKFTTWNWDYIKYKAYDPTTGTYTVDTDPKLNTKTFAPELQWTTAGTPVEWGAEILKATNSKNPEIFNATMAAYIVGKVVGTPAAADVYLEDVVNPSQINSYFTPKFVPAAGTKAAVIQFEKTQNSSNPAADVKQILKMKMTDVFGHKVTLTLGEVTILRQN